MKISTCPKTRLITFLSLCVMFFLSMQMHAQVGIGTVTPDVSAVLDISSITQGMLTPRMTTAQKTAIVSPANGLIVYDTDIKSFFYYDSSTSAWIKVYGDKQGRLMYKLIKSTDVLATVLAAEKTAGGSSKYLLDPTTLYEINGTIMVDLPIELNNSYVAGRDSGDDKLVKVSGDLFTGTTGGSVRVVTLVAMGGNVFNLMGTGSIAAGTQTQSLIVRDCIVANSSSVGKVENFLLAFTSIVNYSGNTTGIVYKDISKLLLSNTGWFGNNSGAYETLQGTFGLVGKVGGFSEVIGTKIGFDTSSNPTITGDAVVRDVVFTGVLTTGKYINGYNPPIYIGYNFNNRWNANSSGVPVEGDLVATGDVNFDYSIGSGALTTVAVLSTPVKLEGITTSNNLYRFSSGGTNNRLTYLGTKSRYFTTVGTISFQSSVSGAADFVFYLAKNGVIINQSKAYSSVKSSDLDTISIVGTVSLSTNDYIEVWVSRLSGSGNVLTVSLNMVVD